MMASKEPVILKQSEGSTSEFNWVISSRSLVDSSLRFAAFWMTFCYFNHGFVVSIMVLLFHSWMMASKNQVILKQSEGSTSKFNWVISSRSLVDSSLRFAAFWMTFCYSNHSFAISFTVLLFHGWWQAKTRSSWSKAKDLPASLTEWSVRARW